MRNIEKRARFEQKEEDDSKKLIDRIFRGNLQHCLRGFAVARERPKPGRLDKQYSSSLKRKRDPFGDPTCEKEESVFDRRTAVVGGFAPFMKVTSTAADYPKCITSLYHIPNPVCSVSHVKYIDRKLQSTSIE